VPPDAAVLDTSRLRLEPLSPAHAEPLYAIYCQPGVRRHLITRPATRLEFDRLFERTLAFAASHGMWAVLGKTTSAVIGRVGFFAFGERARPELAVLLASESWGRGLATEASVACLRHAFGRLGWDEVVALVRPANLAAIAVLGRLGMRHEDDVVLAGELVHLYAVRRGTT
jgi:RimJ/RimL family protein N-acetyltransferase